MRSTSILVVGAGPYGLSLANHLHASGKSFTIIGKPMELWKSHTFTDASLRSDMATSEIAHPEDKYSLTNFRTVRNFPKEQIKERVSVKEYRDYIEWVLEDLPYEIQENYLSNLTKEGDLYQAELDDGSIIEATQVVIATGVAHHLHIPEVFASDDRVVHSYFTQKIEAFKNEKLLVVGAGQSAAEAMEICLDNDNDVEWYSRKAPRFYSEPLDLPKWLFDLVVKSAGLFRRMPTGLIRSVFSIFSATTMTPEYEEMLKDVKRYDELPDLDGYDHIVAATGYHYTLKHMRFLDAELRASLEMREAMPRIDRNFMSSLKDLYFVGPATEMFFGPPMKFMIGSRYAAPKLAAILG